MCSTQKELELKGALSFLLPLGSVVGKRGHVYV